MDRRYSLITDTRLNGRKKLR